MQKYSEYLTEAIKKMSDEKMDDLIRTKYGGFVTTYEYNKEGIGELAKLMDDVLVTKDQKFMHINSRQSPAIKKKLEAIVRKYNLKEVK